MELPKYIRETLQGVTLAIRVQPRSSRDEIIVDPTSDQLKVRITAPPVDSAANKAMLKFIAKSLGIPPRTASLIRGEKSRNKTVLVTGTQAKTVQENSAPKKSLRAHVRLPSFTRSIRRN